MTISLAASLFSLELCNSVLWAIPTDIVPRHAGTAGGPMNTGFGVAGILSPQVFGILVDSTGDWVVPFTVSATFLLVGALTSMVVKPRPIDVATAAEAQAAAWPY